MAEITDLNGNSLHGKTVITLEYEHESGKLSLGGDLSNADRILNMLAQASRHMQAIYDFHKSMSFAAQMEQEKALAREMGRGRLIT